MPLDAMSYTQPGGAGGIKASGKTETIRTALSFIRLFPEDRLCAGGNAVPLLRNNTVDGPMELLDMMDIPEEFEDMRPYLSNYRLNLIQPENAELDNFRTDWKLYFFIAEDGRRWNGK